MSDPALRHGGPDAGWYVPVGHGWQRISDAEAWDHDDAAHFGSDPNGRHGPRPLSELSDSGLLWLINRVVFHPRGFALALVKREGDGEITGWRLEGDGTELWRMEGDEPEFDAAEATFAAARDHGQKPPAS